MPSSTSSSERNHEPPPAGPGGTPGARPRRRLRAVPVAFIAALILFEVCEGLVWNYRPWLEFCARYARPHFHSDPLRIAALTRLLRPQSPPIRPPILLIGSSQVHEGLDCHLFAGRWPGRTCVNLGFAGASPLDVLFVSDRVQSRVPRHVLITGLLPETLNRPPKAVYSNTRTLEYLARSGVWVHLTPDEWLDVVYGQLQNLSETLRTKDALWDMWGVVRADPFAALRLELPAQPPSQLDTQRPMLAKNLERLIGVVDPAASPGSFTPLHDFALEALIKDQSDRGDVTIVIDFPTRPEHQTRLTTEAIRYYRDLLRRLSNRPDVVLVGRADLPPLTDQDFFDLTHVGPSGRRKLSRRVAEILARIEG